MKIKTIEIAVIVAFVITVISTLSFENTCQGVREKVLRLHVVANSDSVCDQSLKYTVRDEILKDGESIFSGSDTAFKAEEKIRDSLSFLRESAENTVRKEGYDYKVSVNIGRMYFPTRKYENITLPAGYYRAVKVIIGEGRGKNWWCVMFPPMCLPAAIKNSPDLADLLSEKEEQIVTDGKKYEIKFWFVEKYYELKEKFIHYREVDLGILQKIHQNSRCHLVFQFLSVGL